MWGTIVLAGGKGKRMGEDKALVKLIGKPLLLNVLETVMGLGNHEIVVVIGKNDESENYSAILPSSISLLRDPVDGKGPLVGILTGMKSIGAEYALVLPCDAPFLNKDVLRYLLHKAGDADAAIPRWPNGDIEPLQAVYRVRSAIPAAESALERGELLILDMIKRLDKVAYVKTEEIRRFDEELLTFFNINSLEDLMGAETMLTRLQQSAQP